MNIVTRIRSITIPQQAYDIVNAIRLAAICIAVFVMSGQISAIVLTDQGPVAIGYLFASVCRVTGYCDFGSLLVSFASANISVIYLIVNLAFYFIGYPSDDDISSDTEYLTDRIDRLVEYVDALRHDLRMSRSDERENGDGL